jgi:multidrug efflux pump subunit AcrA (membrane-fusion protein)
MDMRTTLDIDAPDQAPRRFSTRHMAIGAIALALVAGAGWKTLHQPAKATIAPEIVLGVATPLVSQVVQWDDYVGRFAPSQTVEVRPRVAGQITALHFRDGDIVQKGQILFTVDQRPYRAALAEAQANVASARSALVLAKSDFARVGRLTGDEAVSAGEVDSLRSRVQSAEAALAAALARQQQRAGYGVHAGPRAHLGPHFGPQGRCRQPCRGGRGANATLLTTINALDPIYFDFDSSEALFLKSQRDRAQGGAPQVEIKLQDESGYNWKGRLDFTDNGLDPHSGTIRAGRSSPTPSCS